MSTTLIGFYVALSTFHPELIPTSLIDKLKTIQDDAITSEIKLAINTCQKEFDADIFGFGEIIQMYISVLGLNFASTSLFPLLQTLRIMKIGEAFNRLDIFIYL